MLAQNYLDLSLSYSGYIAGDGDGIVTINSKPAPRRLMVFNAVTAVFVGNYHSLDNGRYLIIGLDPAKEYLIICRDHKREYEPVAYDYVKPATDLTFEAQQTLWASWQQNS